MEEERQFDDLLEETLQRLEEDLKSLEFISVSKAGIRRLELPHGLGWVDYRPLTGLEIEIFEEKRVKPRWRQVFAKNVTAEVELVSDWAEAFRYLFTTAIVDFELKVSPEEVVRFSDFKRREEAVSFLMDLHYKLQRYIAFHILKVSGWEPPRIGG